MGLLRSDKGRPAITPGTSLAMTWGFEQGDPSVLRPQDDGAENGLLRSGKGRPVITPVTSLAMTRAYSVEFEDLRSIRRQFQCETVVIQLTGFFAEQAPSGFVFTVAIKPDVDAFGDGR